MPEQLVKELVQSHHPVLKKHPKSGPWAIILNISNNEHILYILSVMGGRIGLIPFGAVQASHAKSLEDPQRVFKNEFYKKFIQDFWIFSLDSGDQKLLDLPKDWYDC